MTAIQQLLRDIRMDEAEKKEFVPLIEYLITLSEDARRNGLIHLEKEISSEKDFFFNRALSYIVDGVEPEIIRKILFNWIITEDRIPKETFKRILIMEACLMIQMVRHTAIIKEFLYSCLGESFCVAEGIFEMF